MPEDAQLSDSDGVFLVKTARTAVTEFLSTGNRIKLAVSYTHLTLPTSDLV